MIVMKSSNRGGAALGLGAAILAIALLHAAHARAQSNTYGTDQRYCDRSAISQILSTSTGNLVGTAGGAAAGGLIGSQFGKGSGNTVATIVGVLGGALGGGYIGRSMDPADRGCVGTSLQNAPTNQPVAWQNPSSGSSYWLTPTADLRGPHGEPCRKYVADAVINGQRQQTEGTACQQPDGNWTPVAANAVRAAPPPKRPSESTAIRGLLRHHLQGAAAPARSGLLRARQHRRAMGSKHLGRGEKFSTRQRPQSDRAVEPRDFDRARHSLALASRRRAPLAAQCDSSTGMVMRLSKLRVAPPSTSSRICECPKAPMTMRSQSAWSARARICLPASCSGASTT